MFHMTPPTYHVFVQRNGRYGVSLSQSGVIILTETTFDSEAQAQTWIQLDSRPTGNWSRQQANEHSYNLRLR